MHLDTLCLMPDEQRYFLTWRGRLPIFDLTALEVQNIKITTIHSCPTFLPQDNYANLAHYVPLVPLQNLY